METTRAASLEWPFINDSRSESQSTEKALATARWGLILPKGRERAMRASNTPSYLSGSGGVFQKDVNL
jgi:hypothetical protein